VDEIKTVARALEDVLGGMKKAEERLKASAARWCAVASSTGPGAEPTPKTY